MKKLNKDNRLVLLIVIVLVGMTYMFFYAVNVKANSFLNLNINSQRLLNNGILYNNNNS